MLELNSVNRHVFSPHRFPDKDYAPTTGSVCEPVVKQLSYGANHLELCKRHSYHIASKTLHT